MTAGYHIRVAFYIQILASINALPRINQFTLIFCSPVRPSVAIDQVNFSKSGLASSNIACRSASLFCCHPLITCTYQVTQHELRTGGHFTGLLDYFHSQAATPPLYLRGRMCSEPTIQ